MRPRQLLAIKRIAHHPIVSFISLSLIVSLNINMAAAAKTFNILCFGDSLTEGYYNRGLDMHPYAESLMDELNKNNSIPIGYDSISCKALGFSGYRTSQLEQMMEKNEDSFLKDIDLVLIMSGTNDIGNGNDLMNIMKSLYVIHKCAWDKGISTIAMTIPESRFTNRPGAFSDRRDQMNEMIKTEVSTKNNKLCHFINISRLIPYQESYTSSHNPEKLQLWEKDGLHMTAQGYTQFGILLSSLISPIIMNIKQNTNEISKQEEDKNRKTFNILCFGDSLTEGYYNYGQRFHPYSKSLMKQLNIQNQNHRKQSFENDINVENDVENDGGKDKDNVISKYDLISCKPIGFSGYTTKELLEQIQKNQNKYLYEIDLVLIMSGTNDIGETDSDLNDVIQSLFNIHKLIWKKGIPTIAMTIPESHVTTKPGIYQYRRHDFNSMIETEVLKQLQLNENDNENFCHFLDISSLVPYHNDDDHDDDKPLWENDGLHMTHQGYNQFGTLLSSLLFPIIMEGMHPKQTLKQN